MTPAAWAQEITATLRIELIEETRLAPMEVTLEHRDLNDYGFNLPESFDPGFITPFHVLAEGLEQKYGPGAAAERIGMFGTMMGTIDGSFGSSAGEPNVWWMFAVNEAMPVSEETGFGYASNQYRVQNGDAIDFLGMWGGQWPNHSPYLSFFESQTYRAIAGEELRVTLLGLDAFADYGVDSFRKLEGAEILFAQEGTAGGAINSFAPDAVLTDAEGQAVLSFDEPGTYVLSARRLIDSPNSPANSVSDITRPFAVVTVSEAQQELPPNELAVHWGTFRANLSNLAQANAQAPRTNQWGRSLWTHSIGDGSTASSPVKVGDAIYIAGGDTLWKLNSAGTVLKQASLAAPVGQAAFLAASSETIFVPVGAGQVQAFDARTLDSLWTSEPSSSDWQTLGALSYSDGYLYGSAGFDRFMRNSEGSFFCLDAASGDRVWTYSSPLDVDESGFYWSGAAITENAALFAGDDGLLVSHALGTQTARNSGVIDSASLPGGVRSPVLFVENSSSAGGTAFAATRNGYITRTEVSASGSFGATSSAELSGSGSTSTPVIYRDRLYVISGELLGAGYVDVFNALTLERLRSLELPGFSQSSPLLVTGGSTAANGYEVSLFIALNDAQDDLVRIVDSQGADADLRAETFLRPGGSFALSSVSSCDQGRLYFVDGSGRFTAVSTTDQQLESDGGDNGSGNNGGNGSDNNGNNGGGDGSGLLSSGGSDGTTQTPQRNAGEGPKTGDWTDAMRWIFLGLMALTVVFAVIAAKIAERKKEKLKKLEEYIDPKDATPSSGALSTEAESSSK
jgi:hypothetical protein